MRTYESVWIGEAHKKTAVVLAICIGIFSAACSHSSDHLAYGRQEPAGSSIDIAYGLQHIEWN